MRYAVLADIHGNLDALTAALTWLAGERIDRYLCAGDVVGYGAEPAACMRAVDALRATWVAGNHEAACADPTGLERFHEAARRAIEWTRAQLQPADLARLAALPLTATDGPCTLVHGTLEDPARFDYLMSSGQIPGTVERCRTLFCVVGHTHVPLLAEYDRRKGRVSRVCTDAAALADAPFCDDTDAVRYLLNPGSVGQPRDGDPRASLAVIDTGRRRLSVHREPYDVASAQRKILEAGLPEFLAARLAEGR
ncbi:MAG TPA: metallophosphoesterase family protein [bacterium]